MVHATVWRALSLTCPVLRSREDIPAGEGNGDALLLDGAGLFKTFLVDAHQQLPLEQVILKVVALCLCDILLTTRLWSVIVRGKPTDALV